MKKTGTTMQDGEGGPAPRGLRGSTVLAFESRRAAELATLIRHHGGAPIVVPSRREVPLEENSAALEFLRWLERGEIDMVIMLAGVGVRTLAAAVSETCPPARLASLLRRTILVARGPKPVAALRELGLKANITAPEPNTWREVFVASMRRRRCSTAGSRSRSTGRATPS